MGCAVDDKEWHNEVLMDEAAALEKFRPRASQPDHPAKLPENHPTPLKGVTTTLLPSKQVDVEASNTLLNRSESP